MKFLINLTPSRAHFVREQIEEHGAQFANRWYALLRPLIWLSSYFAVYVYSEGSFKFRRLPFSGQFCYWGQKLDSDWPTNARRRTIRRPACKISFFDGRLNRDVQLHFSVILFELFFTWEDVLPEKWIPKDYEQERELGFYYFERALYLKLWAKTKAIYMPWDMVHVRWSVLLKDGNYWHETAWTRKTEKQLPKIKPYVGSVVDEFRYQETFDYTYTLRSGEIQRVTATCGLEEREWRWRWFKWFRVPGTYTIRRSIDIDFSEEVGEERGSWKGGTIGCGYELLPGESIEQCLRRMEKERRFER